MKQRKISKTNVVNFSTYLGMVIFFLVMTALSKAGVLNRSMTGLLVPICCYMSMAVSLNLTVGILGELSLGHAGFMSVGAFAGVIASQSLLDVVPSAGLRLTIAMIVGALFATIAGFIVGAPVLRLQGDYLAIVTLAFGEIIKELVTCLIVGHDENGLHILFNLTGNKTVEDLGLSDTGIAIIKGAQGTASVKTIASFTAGFILVMVTLFIVLNLKHSRAGRAIMALRDNRIATSSIGINTTKYKLMAFVTSAALAGAAGALYGLNYSSLQAAKFNFNTSILVLVFVVLGGLGNIWGSLVAAAALTILPLMEPLLSAIGKDATLTGRTPLWRQIILVMTNSHTFTGYGFGMFWRDRQAVALLHTAFRSNSFMGTMTTGAHNVLLEYWLNVGLFGLASYFIALLASFRQMRKLERQNYIFCAAYMLWFMVMGWTERSMSTYEYQMVFLFLAMGVGSNKPRPVSRRRARLEKEAT